MRIHIAASVLGLLLPFACLAADDGELWEATTQMNIPGMPAGMSMGAQKSSVCRAKNESPGPGRNDCKVTDLKRSGLTETMTVTCPDGTMNIEMTYNAARTEYKGTMRMKSKNGDMTMTTNGRKVGNCDVQQANRAREEKGAKMKAQVEAQVAEGNRMVAKSKQDQLEAMKKECTKAVADMEPRTLAAVLCIGDEARKSGMHCRQDVDAKMRENFMLPEAKTFCETKRTEFCQRLQTEAGFRKAASRLQNKGDDEEASQMRARLTEELKEASTFCGLQPAKFVADTCARAVKSESEAFLGTYCPAEMKQYVALKCARSVKEENLEFIGGYCPAEGKKLGASMCPKALQTEAYSYLGAYCPAEARPMFKKECAGRDFTSMTDRKKASMCTKLAGGLQGEGKIAPRAERATKSATATPTPAPAEAKKASAAEQLQQGVGKGLDKLRGLFGK